MPSKSSFFPLKQKLKSLKLPALSKSPALVKALLIVVGVLVLAAGVLGYQFYLGQLHQQNILQQHVSLNEEKIELETLLAQTNQELEVLKNQDQLRINQDLQTQIAQIESAYQDAVAQYERILQLQETSADTRELEELWAEVLSSLSKFQYDDASATIAELKTEIVALEQKLRQQAAAAAATQTPAVPVSNQAPGSGYSRQQVETSAGTFTVSLVAGDINSTRVIVDTASGGDCGNDCPALAVGEYVARNGGYAGINGSYFCPSTYPTCADKKNSFDFLVMNKDKVYFNSDQNVYSTNPAVIFGGSFIRFVGAASEWGRDTGIDSMLSNYPLLVSGGSIRYTGGGDASLGVKSNRSFVANKGNTVYIGVVHSATVAETAVVLQALGMENGLNLDSGGSTALWSGGYRVGPGRAVPNAIIFVNR